MTLASLQQYAIEKQIRPLDVEILRAKLANYWTLDVQISLNYIILSSNNQGNAKFDHCSAAATSITVWDRNQTYKFSG